MFYKVRIKDLYAPGWAANGTTDAFALVEADNIRTARNLATERIIEVEKATELELVTAGREGWPIISNASEMPTDDGQQPLDFDHGDHPDVPMPPPIPSGWEDPYTDNKLPEPHAQTADTGEASPVGFVPSAGSAPHWLPVNLPATDTGD